MKRKPYAVLVCGGRDYNEKWTVYGALDRVANMQNIGLVISGGAGGADSLALDWAQRKRIPTLIHYANWEKHGRPAGPIRNKEMLEFWEPDLVIAFPGGKGTANMVNLAVAADIPVLDKNLNPMGVICD